MVDEEMVQRPSVAAVLGIGDSLLPANQNPSSGIIGIDLLSGEQLWMICDQLLKSIFQSKGFFCHWIEVSLRVQMIDLLGQFLAPSRGGVIRDFPYGQSPSSMGSPDEMVA